MFERKIIAAAIADRNAYEAVIDTGEGDRLGEGLETVWSAVRDFYQRDPDAGKADPDVLRATLLGSSLNPKRGRQEAELLDSLLAEEVSVPNIRHLLRGQATDRAGMALAAALAGRKPQEEVYDLLEKYQEVTAEDDEPEEDLGWTSAIDRGIDVGARMAVSPKTLNQYMRGGLLPGHNVTIFGRPESGKTALAITMACGFARRGFRVLYIGNEDPIQDLMLRAVCNLSNKTADEVAADPEGAEALALERGALNLIMRELAPGSIREIEAMCRKYKPDVLFIDQLRNIKSGKSDNYTQLLDQNAQAIRAIGKRNGCATVSVTQAGDSASGRPVLDMGDVDSSNTGIPAAADVMIGVGVTQALDAAGQRMLSLCKNKLGYVKPSFPVQLDVFRSKMK
jgi:hypothetical protein